MVLHCKFETYENVFFMLNYQVNIGISKVTASGAKFKRQFCCQTRRWHKIQIKRIRNLEWIRPSVRSLKCRRQSSGSCICHFPRTTICWLWTVADQVATFAACCTVQSFTQNDSMRMISLKRKHESLYTNPEWSNKWKGETWKGVTWRWICPQNSHINCAHYSDNRVFVGRMGRVF